jgi:hypothetical protein
MLVMRTTEIPAYPVRQLVCPQKTVGLDVSITFSMHRCSTVALSTVKDPDMSLTIPEQGGTVHRHKISIDAIDQIHPVGKGDSWMATVIECTDGHYEVQETSYGEAYVWCHGRVMVECDCGERTVLSASGTVCGCGADHKALVQEILSSQRASHPWDTEYDEWLRHKDEYLLSEETYQVELSRLD